VAEAGVNAEPFLCLITVTTTATSTTGRDMAAALSLRLPNELAEKIRRMAELEQGSLAEMVRLLTEEGVRMREFPDIFFVSGATGRRARFRDGLDVWGVLEPYVLAGHDWNAMRKSYPGMDERKLRNAIRYYELYPEEIEARIALNQRG
jgi:uncharacterized protein (DUF433 family)